MEFINKNKTVVNAQPLHMHGERDGIEVEIALQWNDGYAETVYSFANNINTQEGRNAPVGLPLRPDAHHQRVMPTATAWRATSRRASGATTSGRGWSPSSA